MKKKDSYYISCLDGALHSPLRNTLIAVLNLKDGEPFPIFGRKEFQVLKNKKKVKQYAKKRT